MKILIDAKALMHVLGTKMDYVEDRLRLVALTFSALGHLNCRGLVGRLKGRLKA